MADLTPQPISAFREITDITGFNNNSLITLLDANATDANNRNANLKFKNLYSLVKSNLNLTDADINTGVVATNINTNQLTTISSITVNQYGRVVQLAGSNTTTPAAQTNGFTVGSSAGTIKMIQGNTVYGESSNFTCAYTGRVLVTVYFNAVWQYSTGNNLIVQISDLPIFVTNNSNVVTEMPFKTISISTTSLGGGNRGVHTISGTAVLLLPTSPNTTGWKIGAGPTASGDFNYTAVFQNNTQ